MSSAGQTLPSRVLGMPTTKSRGRFSNLLDPDRPEVTNHSSSVVGWLMCAGSEWWGELCTHLTCSTVDRTKPGNKPAKHFPMTETNMSLSRRKCQCRLEQQEAPGEGTHKHTQQTYSSSLFRRRLRPSCVQKSLGFSFFDSIPSRRNSSR